MTRGLIRLLAAGAAAALLLPAAAGAGTATGTLSVSASVSQNCNIATGAALTFGAYDPISANASTGIDDTTNTTLTFNCTKGSSSVYVTANTGSNGNSSGACTTTRSMKSGSNVLCYDLYTDGGFVNVWASSGAAGNATVFSPTFASSHTATATLYGKIPKGQDAVVGASYGDSVTMTINF